MLREWTRQNRQMAKLSRWLTACCILLLSIALTSCGGDEPNESYNSGNPQSEEVTPQVKIITSASTKDEIIVAFKVKSVKKPSVTFSWGEHSSKTSSPSLNRQSNVTQLYEEVPQTGYTMWYYKVTHAGFHPGSYVYFKISAHNSKGSDETSVRYVIIKR